MLRLFVVSLVISVGICTKESVQHGGHHTDHYKAGVHNPVFDQEALLGSENMDELAELDHDARIRRLKSLVTSYDSDNDGIIDKAELKKMIIESFTLFDKAESKQKFVEEDLDRDGKVTFKEIAVENFGVEPDTPIETALADEKQQEKDDADFSSVLGYEKERFDVADLNKDGFLDREEYVAFFAPYNYPHMHPLEISKVFQDMDTNKDGSVSMDEFMSGHGADDDESQKAEMENFNSYDVDKDGKLSEKEIVAFAMPNNDEVADEEVEHLVSMCDVDNDGRLSIDEVVQKEDEFVNSVATDYGRTLRYVKDEL